MSESGRGLITDSVAYLPPSSTPTQTHDFGNQGNGCWKTASLTARNPETVLELDADYNFQCCHIA
jgi:hypothetical protein